MEEPIRYRLAVLTHGRGATLEPALASFYARVTPKPSEVLVYADGRFGNRDEATMRRRGFSVRGGKGRGFCRATGILWRWASDESAPEYVFWLEHDFVFLADIDLAPLAAVLDADGTLAQMALVRNAVSEQEIAAGGLVESRPGEYEAMCGYYDGDLVHPTERWLRHRSYWTTNPSLIRRDFMAANPWPADDSPECEGRFGIELVKRGYSFGVWGSGEPWVEHVGIRSGFGY